MRHGETFPVLTYHSISRAAGPTSIPPETFRMHMDVLGELGYTATDSAGFLAWHAGGAPAGTSAPVLITFDDAFADFADAAHPVLRAHGFRCIVFVPTGCAGSYEAWRGANAPPRPLLDWDAMRHLVRNGVEFGGHGVQHEDLTRLPPDARRREIEGCAEALAEHLGARPRSFAAPYGRVDAAALADIAHTYDIAFGTRCARAVRGCNRFDVPRIEMHYFREERRWREFLRGAVAYFTVRRALRAVRRAGVEFMPAGRA